MNGHVWMPELLLPLIQMEMSVLYKKEEIMASTPEQIMTCVTEQQSLAKGQEIRQIIRTIQNKVVNGNWQREKLH